MDVRTRRLIHNWSRQGTFKVASRTKTEDVYGEPAEISAGHLQGGVFSPLLRLAFFNDVHSDLVERRLTAGLPLEAFLDLLFADDLAIMAVAAELGAIGRYARFSAEAAQKGLEMRHLALQRTKTQNILFKPQVVPGGIYRRTDSKVHPPSKNRIREQLEREARNSRSIQKATLDFDPFEPTVAAEEQSDNDEPVVGAV